MIEPQTPPEPYKITSEYLDYLIGILTGTVTPKAAAEFIPVLEIARMAQLGAAWAETLALVPDGGELDLGQGTDGKVTVKAAGWPGFVEGEMVSACLFDRDDPAAAVLELGEKLRAEKLHV